MSLDYGNLCSVILKQCFGDVVESVGECLYNASFRTLNGITKVTNLSKKEVATALSVLIKYQLVSFNISNTNPNVVEYTLKRDEVLYILRFPRYVHQSQSKYGSVGSAITEEILHAGCQTITNTLLKCISNSDNKEKIESYRNVILAMIKDNYLVRMPLLPKETDLETAPKLHIENYDLFNPPEIDLSAILSIQSGALQPNQTKDAGIFWQVNFSRFHQDFRDAVMIGAIERKLGTSAADCFQFILRQMYVRTDPWQKDLSNPFTFAEIKQIIEKKSNNLDLIKYLDQYVALIADDSLGFIRKLNDMGGGQYVIDFESAFKQLALTTMENVITERFGSKSSRIFRVVRMKKFIEQEDLQKESMIPSKEAKLISYNLFQEQFIQIKTIRKPGGGNGLAKSFYLFHLKQKQIAEMLLDITFKSLYNNITRSNFEKCENRRLIEKSQKLESIVATMKERGEAEEYIAEILETLTPPEQEILQSIKTRIKKLAKAELALDDTIFLLQMYLYYSTNTSAQSNVNK